MWLHGNNSLQSILQFLIFSFTITRQFKGTHGLKPSHHARRCTKMLKMSMKPTLFDLKLVPSYLLIERVLAEYL